MRIDKFFESIGLEIKSDAVASQKMINLIASRIKFTGLDDTINERFMKLDMILGRNVVIFEDKGVLRNGTGNYADKLDFYGEGEKLLLYTHGANTFDVDRKDCIVAWANELHTPNGIELLHDTDLLGDIDTSLKIAIKNTRLTTFQTASTESERIKKQRVIDQLYDGKPLVFVDDESQLSTKDDLFPQLADAKAKSNDFTNCRSEWQQIPSLLQAYDNVYARLCRDFGIPTNNVMKKAQVNTEEVDGWSDLADLTLNKLKEPFEFLCNEVNRKYTDRNWQVHFIGDEEKDTDKDTEKDTGKGAEKDD